mmetsp:Transcript_55342/g.88262  ORF Transcript_55342/g.88262 Transcript_55342/m.88262 type:complete len:133 (-) Transcript_55342:261-659(-)
MAATVQVTPSSPKSISSTSPKETAAHPVAQHMEPSAPLVVIPYPAKIVVHFRPVGSAPILKQKKFKVGSDKLFLSLTKFLKSQLKLSPTDDIYIYCNQAFQPAFDERLGDLYSCFCIGKELVLHYSLVPAWA